MDSFASRPNILILNGNASESDRLKELCREEGIVYTAADIQTATFLLDSLKFNILIADLKLSDPQVFQNLFGSATSILITGKEEDKIKSLLHRWTQDYYTDFFLFPFPDKETSAFLRTLRKAADYSLLRKEVETLQDSKNQNHLKLKEAFSEIKEIKSIIQASIVKEMEKRIAVEAKYLGFRKKKQKIEDILKRIYLANDVTSLLDIVYDIKDIVQAESISIYLIDENETLGKYLKPLVWDNAFLSHPDFSKHVVLMDAQDFAASVVKTAQEIVSSDPHSDKRLSARYVRQLKTPLKSILSVPIMHDKDVIGVLEVYNKDMNGKASPQGFVPEDSRVMLRLCEHISIAITKLNLIQYDALTGLLRPDPFFEKVIQKLKSESKRWQEDLSYALVMGDVDWFKNYNDRNGHEAGNKLLRELAKVLKGSIRDEDFLCRYGGEEFLVFLTGIKDTKEAFNFTERIRKNVEEYYFEHQEFQPKNNLTMSLGITTFKKEKFETPESITKTELKKITNEADMALAEAKGKKAFFADGKGIQKVSPTKNKICMYYKKHPEEPKKADIILPYKETFEREKRKSRRFYTSNVLIYKKQDSPTVTKTINLSLGGAKISTNARLDPDESFDLILVLGDKACQCKGEVRYSEKANGNFPCYYSGIKFRELSLGNRQALENYFTNLSTKASNFH